jgi:SAM-dependent methyltransferase
MEREYDALLDDGDHAALAFENDYRGIVEILRACAGRVADIGGGIGVTRHWLPGGVRYVLVEPSEMWRDRRWQRHAGRFPCLAEPAVAVRAVAEALPFAAASFDAVLFLWSLNHVRDVTRSVREAHRVLRRGGRLLAVLEDMLPGASLQPDHVAVAEHQLTGVPGLRVIGREWFASYLVLHLQS